MTGIIQNWMNAYVIQKWMTGIIQNWMNAYVIQKWMTRIIQNWMIIICSCTRYKRTKMIQNWMIIAYHEKIIHIWMITDGQ